MKRPATCGTYYAEVPFVYSKDSIRTEALGHHSVSFTLNTYSHVLPALQTAAAIKMNAILGGE